MLEFNETQRFRQWWVWLIIASAIAGPILSMVLTNGIKEAELSRVETLMLSVAVPTLVLVLFLMLRLTTRIDGTGVHYRFFPIHFGEKTMLWDEIESIKIRKYKPIQEYGGWGLRYSFKYGKAYNVSGDVGLQLVLKTGKKILIGTRKEEEMRQVLKDLGKL